MYFKSCLGKGSRGKLKDTTISSLSKYPICNILETHLEMQLKLSGSYGQRKGGVRHGKFNLALG